MRQEQLPLGLLFTNEQKAKGNRNSAISRGKTKTTLAYRAHRLRRAGLSTKQIAAALGRSERIIRGYLATPFSTVQATRQRIAQDQRKPKPKPQLHIPAAAAICYLLVPPTKEISEKEEPLTDTKLPPHEEIDVIAELAKQGIVKNPHNPHNLHNPHKTKAPPESKIT